MNKEVQEIRTAALRKYQDLAKSLAYAVQNNYPLIFPQDEFDGELVHLLEDVLNENVGHIVE